MSELSESFLPSQEDTDGMIKSFISEGYRNIKASLQSTTKKSKTTEPSMLSELIDPIFVFDRLNEESLLAAALLKKYGCFRVVDYDQISHTVVKPDEDLCWLGWQPVKLAVIKLKNRHIAFLGHRREPASQTMLRSVIVRYGNYDGVVEQIINEILYPLFENDPDIIKVIEQWIGIGYLVSQFCHKRSSQEMLVKAFSAIRMAYDYLYYDDVWDPTVIRNENAEQQTMLYYKTVEESKKLLRRNAQTRWSFYRGRMTATQFIHESTYRWYTMKRLIVTSGQQWKAPIIVADKLFYGDNKQQPIAA